MPELNLLTNISKPMHAVTIAIPTIGRVDMLSSCLDSIARGSSLPKEILLADQSGSDAVFNLVENYEQLPIRVVTCEGKGIAKNMNLILRSANHEQIAVTHDDCVVGQDWLDQCVLAQNSCPGTIFTGSVLPGGEDPKAVPSTNLRKDKFDFTGTLMHGALYPNNMILTRTPVLELGGFDERDGFLTAAEDLDFSYRWLKAEKSLKYDPKMVVTHNDWRTPVELVMLYKHYARCAGRFYGKHLAAGDFVPLWYGLRDMLLGVKAWKRKIIKGTVRWHDERLELPLWVPVGIVEGLWESWVTVRSAKSRVTTSLS